ncbi:MAG: hypothetical protein A2748_03445 [Candidatus Wildermuthbacteria bacterium RIFCSPHIGHO2_01_FULL_45_20]|nr:MAG: hypothetical protein A2748_03445 [Candidatus Wildermuthbacteria bacterium RIFCSPHIGHO2_01_FULL_45_20]
MVIFSFAIIFCFGLVVGSFLNALTYRLAVAEGLEKKPKESASSSVLNGRSYCPQCGHKLSWFDLVPLASFFFLKGKCRYCAGRISWQYPLVELATGCVFILLSYVQHREVSLQYWNFENLLLVAYTFCLASFMIAIFVYDWKHYLIPDHLLFLSIGLTLVYLAWRSAQTSSWDIFLNAGFAALIAAGFFLALFLVSRGRWMGFGDVKLALFMGLFLGWPGILVALFIAFVLGAIIGLALIGFGKKRMKSEVPFGPFLLIATLIAYAGGETLASWYIRFVLI